MIFGLPYLKSLKFVIPSGTCLTRRRRLKTRNLPYRTVCKLRLFARIISLPSQGRCQAMPDGEVLIGDREKTSHLLRSSSPKRQALLKQKNRAFYEKTPCICKSIFTFYAILGLFSPSDISFFSERRQIIYEIIPVIISEISCVHTMPQRPKKQFITNNRGMFTTP